MDEKKNEDLKPTDIAYDCEPEINVLPTRPHLMPLHHPRPSFGLFAAETKNEDIDEDLRMLNKKRQTTSLELIPGRKTMSFSS